MRRALTEHELCEIYRRQEVRSEVEFPEGEETALWRQSVCRAGAAKALVSAESRVAFFKVDSGEEARNIHPNVGAFELMVL